MLAPFVTFGTWRNPVIGPMCAPLKNFSRPAPPKNSSWISKVLYRPNETAISSPFFWLRGKTRVKFKAVIAKTLPCEAGTITSVLTVLIAPVPASTGPPNLYSILDSADQYFQPQSFSKSRLNSDSNLPFHSLSRLNPPDAVP